MTITTSASFSRILFLMSRSVIDSASEGFLGIYRRDGKGGREGGREGEVERVRAWNRKRQRRRVRRRGKGRRRKGGMI